MDGPAVLGLAAWREGDAAGSGRHLAEAVAELRADGLLGAPAAAALVPMVSGALNEATLWAAEAEDQEAAIADTLQVLRAWLTAVRGT